MKRIYKRKNPPAVLMAAVLASMILAGIPAEALAGTAGTAEAQPAEAETAGTAEEQPAETKTAGTAEAQPAEAETAGTAEEQPAEAKTAGAAEAQPGETGESETEPPKGEVETSTEGGIRKTEITLGEEERETLRETDAQYEKLLAGETDINDADFQDAYMECVDNIYEYVRELVAAYSLKGTEVQSSTEFYIDGRLRLMHPGIETGTEQIAWASVYDSEENLLRVNVEGGDTYSLYYLCEGTLMTEAGGYSDGSVREPVRLPQWEEEESYTDTLTNVIEPVLEKKGTATFD